MPENDTLEKLEGEAKKAVGWVSQLVSARNLIIGVIAVVTAISSWFKPTDTSATKEAYKVLVAKISTLEDAIESNHTDLEAQRAYLEGYTQGKVAGASTVASASASSVLFEPPPPKVVRPTVKAPKVSVGFTLKPEDPETSVAAKEAPPRPPSTDSAPPSITPLPAKAALPPFDDVVRHVTAD